MAAGHGLADRANQAVPRPHPRPAANRGSDSNAITASPQDMAAAPIRATRHLLGPELPRAAGYSTPDLDAVELE